MSDVILHDSSTVPSDGDDPLGPFGTGPAMDDPEPWVDPVYEQFGDYDPFGPWASRDADYSTDLPDPDPLPFTRATTPPGLLIQQPSRLASHGSPLVLRSMSRASNTSRSTPA